VGTLEQAGGVNPAAFAATDGEGVFISRAALPIRLFDLAQQACAE